MTTHLTIATDDATTATPLLAKPPPIDSLLHRRLLPPISDHIFHVSIFLYLSLSLFSFHLDTHSFHFHFGGNPFFFPFDFYSALFGDLGFVCLGFGLCLWSLRILGLHGYWFGLQICVIWAYILLDIVIGLIWISLIFVFLGVWTGVLALC